ncbi:YrdB family protein [Ruegeria atlantica]|uniref:DUF2568 domain-containing protein n=1 Tax=Ruegeria atlantica TaxID=81569 RepID=A0A0P1ETC3_9RHOB|nr:YrdB family protein [Ruegeria atlantica]CUH43962.1 hypothetical protein RUM4293_02859 [Ruegeria atlantica]
MANNNRRLYDTGMCPANLILRFLLELSALTAFAVWVWGSTAGIWRLVFSILVIAGLAMIWGVFAVPDDPSRSGAVPVPIPGVFRLFLELLILGGAGLAFFQVGLPLFGGLQIALVAFHYAFSIDRIRWLLQL